jgi:hypothetical protein
MKLTLYRRWCDWESWYAWHPLIFQDECGDWHFVWLERIRRRREFRKWEYALSAQR